LYKEKLNLADSILKDHHGYNSPEAGFFLWIAVNDGEEAAVNLWRDFGVKVLPGSYLSNENYKTFNGQNPGKNYIRVALVRPIQEIEIGLKAISQYLTQNT
jgi:aspartate/methionine/tyrosine aminotransferase